VLQLVVTRAPALKTGRSELPCHSNVLNYDKEFLLLSHRV